MEDNIRQPIDIMLDYIYCTTVVVTVRKTHMESKKSAKIK